MSRGQTGDASNSIARLGYPPAGPISNVCSGVNASEHT